VYVNGTLRPGVQDLSGSDVGAFLSFGSLSSSSEASPDGRTSARYTKQVQLFVGISFISVAQAELNLNTEIINQGWQFADVKLQAQKLWQNVRVIASTCHAAPGLPNLNVNYGRFGLNLIILCSYI